MLPEIQRPALPELGGPYFRALPVPAAVVALPTGHILDINGAWVAAFGYTPAEALGRTIADLNLAADPDQPDYLLDIIEEASTIASHEIELRDKAGRRTPYLLSVSAISVAGQACALAVAQSIRGQKQLEGALAESVVKFRTLFDASRDAIGVAKAGRHEYVNRAYLELFGVSDPADLLGRALLDLIAPGSRAQVRALTQQRAQGDSAADFYETRGLRSDGTEFDMEVKASVYELNGERFTLALIRDITDRKQARFAMQERLKEMTCLTRVGLALSRGLTPAELGQEICTALVAAMQYPDLTVPVLEYDDQRFAGDGYQAALTHCLQADLWAQGTRHGRLAVYYREPRAFQLPYEQDLIDGLARMLSLWLERQAEQRNREAIIAMGAALRTASTRAEMLPAVLDQIQAFMEVEDVALVRAEPGAGSAYLEAARGAWELQVGQQFARDDGLGSRVLATGQTFHSNNFQRETVSHQLAVPAAVVGLAVVPLIAHGQTLGLVAAGSRRPLDPTQVRLLEAIAAIAASALQRARHYEEAQQRADELAQAYDSTIEGWSRALDFRDHETEGHSRRVTLMALALAGAMGLAGPELVHIRRGALLHDIGKMGVPDAILHKPGPLTDAEWASMRRHPGLAHDMLAPIVFLGPALDIPYCHHERWDGSGYPRGLRGADIPLSARIFAVVDVWDALTSDRPYRPAWSAERTRAYLLSKAGTEFDPDVVRIFFEREVSRQAAAPLPGL